MLLRNNISNRIPRSRVLLDATRIPSTLDPLSRAIYQKLPSVPGEEPFIFGSSGVLMGDWFRQEFELSAIEQDPRAVVPESSKASGLGFDRLDAAVKPSLMALVMRWRK